MESSWKIFLTILLAFILGTIFAPYFEFNFLLSTLISFFGFLLFKKKELKIFWLILLFFFLGITRYQTFLPNLDKTHLAFYNDRKVKIKGIVINYPELREKSIKFILKAEELKTTDQFFPIRGKVLVTANLYSQPIKYGDRLILEGFLKTPPEEKDFSYKNYLKRFKIFSIINFPRIKKLEEKKGNFFYQILFLLKDKIKEKIIKLFPEPFSSFIGAILLGTKKALPVELKDKFIKTGTIHIVVISGLHLMILGGILREIFKNFSPKLFFLILLGFILIYIIFTGAKPSILRAGIMTLLLSLAPLFGRKGNSLVALIFAAFLLILINPLIVHFDLSFKLSFAAMVGLILINPFLREKINPFPLDYLILPILSVQLTTLPLISYYFGKFTPFSIIPNIIIIPLLFPLIFFSLISVGICFFSFFLGKIFAIIPFLILNILFLIVDFFSSLPIYISFKLNLISLFIYYGGLFLLMKNVKRV